MYANHRNVRVFLEIGAEEHDCDVRFKSGSGNTAISCMRNTSGHNYRNHCKLGYGADTTERISSLFIDVCLVFFVFGVYLSVFLHVRNCDLWLIKIKTK